MLKHIKLTTVSRLFSVLMLLTCIILAFGTLFLERNISLIGTTWELFQTDRSEKSRLESSLRAAIGYGGMIHEFKNYILRQEPARMDLVQSDIGAAKAVLNQYSDLETSAAEAVALEDIESVLNHYEKALLDAEHMIEIGKSADEIDAAVRIDDSPALRGLKTLRQEVRQTYKPDSHLSKARINADLRAAIGYGGIIHEFKNYVLRHDAARIAVVEQKLQEAYQAIELYHHLDPSNGEMLALDDINMTLLAYGKNLKVVMELINKGVSSEKIDQTVRINDHPALRGLGLLDKEISRQVIERSGAVSEALKLVQRTLSMSTWGVILLLLFVAAITVWVMQWHVIGPILRLTRGMTKLADNDLSVKFDNHYRDNELGNMERTVMIFRANMIERDEAEAMLADTNEEMNLQLENIQRLREQSEEQATKALNLAEGLSAARESAEKAVARAEQEELHVRSILDAVRDAIITIDTQGMIESVNPGTEVMFGYRADELIGKNISLLTPEPIRSQHDGYLAHFIEGVSQRDISHPAEQTALRKDGSAIEVDISLNTMMVNDELKIMGVVRDITERKQWEKEINRMAMTDPLTELANRNQYNLKLEEAVALSKRNQQPFALLLIDLDKFKPVNDTYGHPVGDKLLQHVSQVISNICREIDTVARLGGDEFAIILVPTERGLNVEVPSQRIIDQLSQPVTIEEHTIAIGASIGISYYPQNSADIEELQRQADSALYDAKEAGRNTYRIFSDEVSDS